MCMDENLMKTDQKNCKKFLKRYCAGFRNIKMYIKYTRAPSFEKKLPHRKIKMKFCQKEKKIYQSFGVLSRCDSIGCAKPWC